MTQRKAAPAPVERVYPGIEVFLENNSREAIAERFAETREAIAGLPKPKAEQGKRALSAIARTETLLGQLFDVKEKIEGAGAKKTRR